MAPAVPTERTVTNRTPDPYPYALCSAALFADGYDHQGDNRIGRSWQLGSRAEPAAGMLGDGDVAEVQEARGTALWALTQPEPRAVPTVTRPVDATAIPDGIR